MPASSLLMVILLLWSGPVLIYAILFFPELKQLVMGEVGPNRNDESDKAGSELPFEYLLPMVAAATVALIFGLLVTVSWPVCLMLMGAAAALIGGVAFTFLQIHSLALPKKASHSRPTAIAGLETRSPAANPSEAATRTNTSHIRIM